MQQGLDEAREANQKLNKQIEDFTKSFGAEKKILMQEHEKQVAKLQQEQEEMKKEIKDLEETQQQNEELFMLEKEELEAKN